MNTRKVRRVAPALTIALCIPFDIKDLRYLIQCLLSIKHQTRQPDLVVFSFSRVPAPVQEKIRDWVDRFPLLPTTHLLFSEARQYAGKNRNVAARFARERGADIISFIDSDDIAHPRRLEMIERSFLRKPELDALLHSYMSTTKGDPTTDFSTINWEDPRGRLYKNCFYIVKRLLPPWRMFTLKELVAFDPGAQDIQNGHLSIRASVWEANPYREDLNAIEDSDYNAHLYEKKMNIGLISDKLVLYMYSERPRPTVPVSTSSSLVSSSPTETTEPHLSSNTLSLPVPSESSLY
jgi:hypothetical protein